MGKQGATTPGLPSPYPFSPLFLPLFLRVAVVVFVGKKFE